jgi:hypothetical protein
MKKLKVLVACEYSGAVRDAFSSLGHDATSCDLLPTEKPGKHHHGDVFEIINDGWDLMVAHPPCTYLCSSGLHWNKRVLGRQQLTDEAVDFVLRLYNCGIGMIAIENPIGCLSTKLRKPDQIIQPYNFGDDASKSTCLWLKNLPTLQPTSYVEPRIVNGKKRWANQTDSGQNRLGPSDDRWKERSKTYQGIADAMALQWGGDAR